MKHVSTRELARLAGVSAQTVSRALRGAPGVRAALRRKIERLARKLDYAPDPRMRAYLGHIRKRQAAGGRETVSLVLPDCGARELERLYYLREIARGARERAAAHGFQLELRALGDRHDLRSLEREWAARGMDLLIVAPHVHTPRATLALHWERYAAAAIGPALWRPRLSRAVVDYYLNMAQLLRQLRRLGYRRPALVCREAVLERQMYVWEAAFQKFAPSLGLAEPERLVWREGVEQAGFRKWLRERRADVVIGDYHGDLAVLRGHGFAVPGEVGFASLTWNADEPGIAGFDSRWDFLGAHAVELVAEQFYHHERGVPKVAKLVSHEGVWRNGGTVRRR